MAADRMFKPSLNRRFGFRARSLQMETLETRQLCAIDLRVEPPVVTTFLANAEVSGLQLERTSQPTLVQTIDILGVRRAVKEIDGVVYSFQGENVVRTEITTGASLSFPVRPLTGTSGVEIRDVGLVEGKVIFVGGSLTGANNVSARTIATQWDETGTPVRLGPATVNGLATFIREDGVIGGFLERVTGEYTPWLHSAEGDFFLPASEIPTAEQMVLASSTSGQFLTGYAGVQPMVWQTSDTENLSAYELAISPEFQMEFPAGAILSADATKRFTVVEDGFGDAFIYGQYGLPIFNQGQQVGVELHAGIWSISGAPLRDFGAGTEMLGVVTIGGSQIVAHRNSISIVSNEVVRNLTIDSLLPTSPPAGTTRRILDNGVFVVGSLGSESLGISFAEVSATGTVNKVAVVPLKYPLQVRIDAEADGTFEGTFSDADIQFPNFVATTYGQRTLIAQVLFSDNSTESASVNYEALPFEAIDIFTSRELRIGGTLAADQVSLESLGANSYRATTGVRTRDFDSINEIQVNLSDGNDSLEMIGAIDLNLNALVNVEAIEMHNTTAQRLIGVDSGAVQAQVGASGTLVVRTDAQDTVEILGDWVLQAPISVQGRVLARLTSDGVTLDLVNEFYSNPVDNLDVTADGFISARDALLIINHINQSAGGVTPAIDAYVDVNNNGTISALDVLLVINHINNAAGEGESSAVASQAVSDGANHDACMISDDAVTSQWIDVDSLPIERKRR